MSRRLLTLHGLFHLDHVEHGNAFGDGDDELDAGVDGFHDGVGGEGRRHEDDGGGGAGLLDGFAHGVEDGKALRSRCRPCRG